MDARLPAHGRTATRHATTAEKLVSACPKLAHLQLNKCRAPASTTRRATQSRTEFFLNIASEVRASGCKQRLRLGERWLYCAACDGGVAEWLKAHAWNACRRATVSWVRIPPPPPATLEPTPGSDNHLKSPVFIELRGRRHCRRAHRQRPRRVNFCAFRRPIATGAANKPGRFQGRSRGMAARRKTGQGPPVHRDPDAACERNAPSRFCIRRSGSLKFESL